MEHYKNQVALLVSVLPEVAKEKCFALHGGTAINLFVRNMPRLSVDLDLTYIPIEDRQSTFTHVQEALARIKENIKKIDRRIQVNLQAAQLKLQIQNPTASIKVEVNQGMRGLLAAAEERVLCEKTQEEFDAFCVVNCVPHHQLFGGKICAALDRQHPRDLFDVNYLLENEGFTTEIKKGFIFCMLCSNRPIVEILFPSETDQEQSFQNQFKGMTKVPFGYEDFLRTRSKLIETIHANLNEYDIDFLIHFASANPDWSVYNFEEFPAVQWKLKNIEKLKAENPAKFEQRIEKLKTELNQLKD